MTDTNKSAGNETEQEAALPIVEEELDVTTREVTGRTVTVTTSPVVERRTVSEPVVHEQVTVERVPIGKVVQEAPEVREEGDLTVIPVVEERIAVVKELVLTEEIHLRRIRHEVTDEQIVELSRTEVKIDG